MYNETFPIWECLPAMLQMRSSQIAFRIVVLPKDDHTDFVQGERLGLPYWTMILAVCVVVDESKCLDTQFLEFSIICEHLPFVLGYKPILRLWGRGNRPGWRRSLLRSRAGCWLSWSYRRSSGKGRGRRTAAAIETKGRRSLANAHGLSQKSTLGTEFFFFMVELPRFLVDSLFLWKSPWRWTKYW